jgi:hypothetical protein
MELESYKHQENIKVQDLEHLFTRQLKDLSSIVEDLKIELQVKDQTIKHYENLTREGSSLS